MKQKFTEKWQNSGITLVEVLLGASLTSLVMFGGIKVFELMQRNENNISKRIDFNAAKNIIISFVDCEETFRGINPYDSGLCNTSSQSQSGAGTYLTLRKSGGQALTEELDSDGSGYWGDLKIRATCSASEESLIVQAALVDRNTGHFKTDPITNTPYDWNHSKSLLIGGLNWPLCYNPKMLSSEITTETLDLGPSGGNPKKHVIGASNPALVISSVPCPGRGGTCDGIKCPSESVMINCYYKSDFFAVFTMNIQAAAGGQPFSYDRDSYIYQNACYTPDQHIRMSKNTWYVSTYAATCSKVIEIQ